MSDIENVEPQIENPAYQNLDDAQNRFKSNEKTVFNENPDPRFKTGGNWFS